MGSIGFTYNKKTEYKKSPESVLTFDSGRELFLNDIVRNVLVLGQTGAGKTTSAILPICKSLISMGLGGIIFDIKGTMYEKILQYAEDAGRENDIIELGLHDKASPVNILYNTTYNDRIKFLATLSGFNNNIDISNNREWASRGVSDLSHVLSLLKALPEISEKKISPFSLKGLYEIYNDHSLIKDLKEAHKKYPVRGNTILSKECQMALKNSRSDTFSILAFEQEKEELFRWQEQVSWRCQNTMSAINLILAAENSAEKFCATSSCENFFDFNFEKSVFKNKKIILVHFPRRSGLAGELLGKLIRLRWRESVLDHEVDKSRVFTIMDEYQALASLDPSEGMTDAEFFGLSREFGCANVISMQSVDSLAGQGRSQLERLLLDNCSIRIAFQSSSRQTIEWLESVHVNIPDISQLTQGQVFVAIAGGTQSLESLSHEFLAAKTSRPKVKNQRKQKHIVNEDFDISKNISLFSHQSYYQIMRLVKKRGISFSKIIQKFIPETNETWVNKSNIEISSLTLDYIVCDGVNLKYFLEQIYYSVTNKKPIETEYTDTIIRIAYTFYFKNPKYNSEYIKQIQTKIKEKIENNVIINNLLQSDIKNDYRLIPKFLKGVSILLFPFLVSATYDSVAKESLSRLTNEDLEWYKKYQPLISKIIKFHSNIKRRVDIFNKRIKVEDIMNLYKYKQMKLKKNKHNKIFSLFFPFNKNYENRLSQIPILLDNLIDCNLNSIISDVIEKTEEKDPFLQIKNNEESKVIFVYNYCFKFTKNSMCYYIADIIRVTKETYEFICDWENDSIKVDNVYISNVLDKNDIELFFKYLNLINSKKFNLKYEGNFLEDVHEILARKLKKLMEDTKNINNEAIIEV